VIRLVVEGGGLRDPVVARHDGAASAAGFAGRGPSDYRWPVDEPGPPDAFEPRLVESTGPIQMLTIAFPGNRFRGEILPELERLKHNEIVRIIDLLMVRKDASGNIMVTTATDLDWEEAVAFGSWAGALAGYAAHGADGVDRGAMEGAAQLADGHLFDEDDVFRVTRSLPRETSAALVLLEHLWMKPLVEAIDRANGLELANEWIRIDEVVTLDGRRGVSSDGIG
jgi:uncharacterized membrane protein